MKRNHPLFTFSWILLLGILGYLLIHWYFNLPEVHVSWSTKECVRIIIKGEEKPCTDKLPDRYLRTWTK